MVIKKDAFVNEHFVLHRGSKLAITQKVIQSLYSEDITAKKVSMTLNRRDDEADVALSLVSPGDISLDDTDTYTWTITEEQSALLEEGVHDVVVVASDTNDDNPVTIRRFMVIVK